MPSNYLNEKLGKISQKNKNFFRQMLQKDVSKTTDSAEKAKKDLTEKCRVSSDIRTPRMLEAVAKILPHNSETSKQLSDALEKS